MHTHEIVWLTEERTFAELVNLGAYYSLVTYERGGLVWEVLVSNDEFEFREQEGDGDGTQD